MKVSIVIRSKNEERFIGAVLKRVLEQKFTDPYEVIVLDSGSQDRTLDIVRGFPVRLATMAPEQFTFGRALNQGAALTSGDIVVFLSAHCVPRERTWLRELTAPLSNDAQVAATYGRQEPMPGVNPFEEIELERTFGPTADGAVLAHFSNANSAIRRHLVTQYPFDEEVTGGEDYLWAQGLPPSHTVRYVATASVFHSHPPSLRYWRRRAYIEGLFMPYLAQRGIANPWVAPSTAQEQPSRFKWHVLTRWISELRWLCRRRYFAALLYYPLYETNRIYFYTKGKRDGRRRYPLAQSPLHHVQPTTPD
ncbi:MAG: glycosyltransferase family 2 protein [Deltaproteobacteria bacterium]|nr:glycosyltransferase family 2 protein [Deltaproteobacteria bacterium]